MAMAMGEGAAGGGQLVAKVAMTMGAGAGARGQLVAKMAKV